MSFVWLSVLHVSLMATISHKPVLKRLAMSSNLPLIEWALTDATLIKSLAFVGTRGGDGGVSLSELFGDN